MIYYLSRNTIKFFIKRKLYFIFNLVCVILSTAIILTALIFTYSEFNYDKWIPNYENVFRIDSIYHSPNRPAEYVAGIPLPVLTMIKNRAAGIENITRVFVESAEMRTGPESSELEVLLVDQDFRSIFPMKAIAGDPAQALTAPNRIIFSRSQAMDIFGTTAVVGKVINMSIGGLREDYVVAAVVEDFPETTHFHAGAFIQFNEKFFQGRMNILTSWGSIAGYTYVKFANHRQAMDLQRNRIEMVKEATTKAFGRSYANVYEFYLEPTKNIHLDARAGNPFEAGQDNYPLIVGVGLFGLFAFLVTAVNFTTSTLQEVTRREHEFFVRRVCGAHYGHILLQVLFENTVLLAIGATIGTSLYFYLTPVFENTFGGALAESSTPLMVALGLVPIASMLLVPLAALFFKVAHWGKALGTRVSWTGVSRKVTWKSRAYMATQFALCLTVTVIAAVVWQQLSFLTSRSLGFDTDKLFIVSTNRNLSFIEIRHIRARLKANPDIAAYSLSSNTVGDGDSEIVRVSVPGESDGEAHALDVDRISVDSNFLKTYGIRSASGRWFKEGPHDKLASLAVIGDTAIGQLGLRDSKTAMLRVQGESQVIGVIHDPVFNSLSSGRRPAIYVNSDKNVREIAVRFANDVPQSTANALVDTLREMSPDLLFRGEWANARVAALYRDEHGHLVMIGTISAFTIMAALSGIFVITYNLMSIKRREYALRQLFGASVPQLAWLAIKFMAIPLLLGVVLGMVGGYYCGAQYLQMFSEHFGALAAMVLSVCAILFSALTCLILGIVLVDVRRNLKLSLNYVS